MSTVQKSIEVDVPVRTAYDQWTQFETFPQFMQGVKEIEQFDDTTTRWRVELAGRERTFDADIVAQEPDERVAWRSRGEEDHAGSVTFQPVTDTRTRVAVQMVYNPQKWTDKAADALNLIDQRVEGDLERFKQFIEQRGVETGAWRGEVREGQQTNPG